jgi:hypothetical protein
MDKVQKYVSTNANTPSSETYRSDLSSVLMVVMTENSNHSQEHDLIRLT